MVISAETSRLLESCRRGDLDAKSIDNITSLRDKNGMSLLSAAIAHKHKSIVKQLLQYDFMPTDEDKASVLCIASASEELSIVELVLDKIGNITPDVCNRAFKASCLTGRGDVVRLLLSRCSSLTDLELNQRMVDACERDHVNITRELIDAGADAHLNPDGKFFIDAISRNSSTASKQAVIDVLTDAGCVINTDHWRLWQRLGGCGAIAFVEECLDRWEPPADCIKDAFSGACVMNDAEMIKCLCDYSDNRQYETTKPNKIDDMIQLLVLLRRADLTTCSPDMGACMAVRMLRFFMLLLLVAWICSKVTWQTPISN
jgi:ankyrin repeat protein